MIGSRVKQNKDGEYEVKMNMNLNGNEKPQLFRRTILDDALEYIN